MSTSDPIQLPHTVWTDAADLLPREEIKSYWEIVSSINRKVNLVSRETTAAAFERLVVESLLPLVVLEGNFPGYIDIGSGGGLPAIPLLLSGRVRQPSLLYERIGKKAIALREIVRALGLFAEIVPENFGERSVREPVSLVTMRLVAPELKLIRQVVMSMKPEGFFVYYGLKPLPPMPGFVRQSYILPSESADIGQSPRGFTIVRRQG